MLEFIFPKMCISSIITLFKFVIVKSRVKSEQYNRCIHISHKWSWKNICVNFIFITNRLIKIFNDTLIVR